MSEGTPIDTLTAADFEPYVESRFEIVDGASAFPVVLAEVSAFTGSGPPEGSRAPFSLIFHGPPDPLLEQRIYRLEHDDLGMLELFLVPIGPDGADMCYQAVFG